MKFMTVSLAAHLSRDRLEDHDALMRDENRSWYLYFACQSKIISGSASTMTVYTKELHYQSHTQALSRSTINGIKTKKGLYEAAVMVCDKATSDVIGNQIKWQKRLWHCRLNMCKDKWPHVRDCKEISTARDISKCECCTLSKSTRTLEKANEGNDFSSWKLTDRMYTNVNGSLKVRALGTSKCVFDAICMRSLTIVANQHGHRICLVVNTTIFFIVIGPITGWWVRFPPCYESARCYCMHWWSAPVSLRRWETV